MFQVKHFAEGQAVEKTVNRQEKQQKASDVKKGLESAALVVITEQSGLSASETSSLRSKVHADGVHFNYVKKTLARIALKGTQYEGLSSLMKDSKSPTAIAYSQDPVAAARVLANFANDNDKLRILGGAMGEKALDKNAVIALSKLPSLNELRGKLVGLLQAPATKVAGVVQAPAGKLARVFAAYGNKS